MSRLTTLITSKAKLAAIKVAITVLPAPRPIVLLGEDSAVRLCATIAHLSAKRVLIVTDDILFKLGVITPIAEALTANGVASVVFSGVKPDPTMSVVEQGLTMLRAERCDAVLAVGGGSSIDAAKVIALSYSNNKHPRELVGILKARKPSLPLFVVPTTAGTGSEVTVGAVISDDVSHQKGLVLDPRLVPLATALDPKIMAGMPRGVTADTGMDALTHALEAWMSDFANAETDYYAGAAVGMIFNNLPVAWADGKNLQAREALGLASHYAGLALNHAGLGYVHGIAHQLGAFYGVPHGRANATVLPHILDFNRDVSMARLAQLARQVELAGVGQSDRVAADNLIKHVKQLVLDLQINTHIPKMNAGDFPAIIAGAFAEVHGTYAVAKYMDEDEALKILYTLQQPAQLA